MNPLTLAPKLKLLFFILAGGSIFILGSVYFFLFAAPGGGQEKFIIKRETEQKDIVLQLKDAGFIKNIQGFKIAQKIVNPLGRVRAGGYNLDRGANAFSIARSLMLPDEKWIVVLEGVRKEEIADVLSDSLAWSATEKETFLSYTSPKMFGLTDGVFFPETYLVPRNTGGTQIAERMVNQFHEEIATYSKEFAAANVKTDTALKLASLVQREAANEKEMPLIAGILWNRLDQKMRLGIDASIQYARGKTDTGWWAPIKSQDKNIDSPYNTYKYDGLPPGPISNPGIAAILAVLKPEKTACLFYLHDSGRKIHCAKTYEEHLANINRYLK